MSNDDKLRIAVSLLRLFGERYVDVDDEQALLDCKYGREELVNAYSAIMEILRDMDD